MFLNNGMEYNPRPLKLTKIQVFLSKLTIQMAHFNMNFRKAFKGIEKVERWKIQINNKSKLLFQKTIQ